MVSGRSSADPGDLDGWVNANRGLDTTLSPHQVTLANLQNEFTTTSQWGGFDATSLIGGLKTYLGYNETDSQWTSTIAGMFHRADSSGGVVSLPDSVIAAGLKAAGLTGGRQSVTFDDPIAWGEPPTSGYANDPVNTASGNFVDTETDLAFTGLLAKLAFTRTYNSRSDRIGPFGRGWASWATTRLRAAPDGAHWESPDGQRATIPPSANGTGYRRMVGIPGRVVPTPDGLALEWFGGGRWEFDTDGLPRTVDRRPGHAGAVCPRTGPAGRADPRGRQTAERGMGWRPDRRAGVLGRPPGGLPLRPGRQPDRGRRRAAKTFAGTNWMPRDGSGGAGC